MATQSKLTSALPETGFVRLAQIIPDIIPVSRTQIWRWVREKRFPAPVKLSAQVTVWRAEEVRAWIEAQSSKSSGKAA